ncbi:MAG: pilus assembly protein [Mesorhizobium sp.]|nr:TadE/TadG family type IV pilus assembly protein [Mesorhizobium sp.]MCO5160860.1 pilus assembly protein [Mesorhizobium sp.]
MNTSDNPVVPAASKQRAVTRKRRFLRDRNGNVAIEFSLLAIPFSLLVFAILESCISFAGSQLLANATDNVARQLRTGQVKAAGLTEASVKQLICDQIDILVASGCPGLKIDLRQYSTFKDAAAMKIVYVGSGSEKELATTNFAFNPGKSMTKNMLRVFYEWPVMTDFMRKAMSNLKGGKTLHFASMTWQNEPFDD